MNGRVIGITGAGGFVGRRLCGQLASLGFIVRRLVRSASPSDAGVIEIGDIGPDTDWSSSLEGVSTVIHCAARAHVMSDSARDPLGAYRHVNVAGTRRLAEQAAALGVKRLVFLSSVKVNGEFTHPGKPFTSPRWLKDARSEDEGSDENPRDAYGISKREAEQALRHVAQGTSLEVVVVRSPLVYGPGVRANFLQLMILVQRGYPLPFGLIDNRRSLVGLGNLADLLIRCAESPEAKGQTFMVSDGHDLSTPQLIRSLAQALGVRSCLLPVPPKLLRLGGGLLGGAAEIQRMVQSLEVDILHTCQTLDWTPPFSVEESLRHAADWFLQEHSLRGTA